MGFDTRGGCTSPLEAITLSEAAASAAREASDRVRAERLRAALEAANGNVTRTARALGVSRGHAHRLLRRFELGPFARDLRDRCLKVRSGVRSADRSAPTVALRVTVPG